MSARTYTSSIARLRAVPEIFTGGDLTVLFGWKSGICSSYLAAWRKAGLIASLGGRADVHLNLLRNPQVSTAAALRRVFPRAIKVGVDILREEGWTTQIPSVIDIALPGGSAHYALTGFSLTTRTEKWFQLVAPGVNLVPQAIDALMPAWALADMIARAQDARVRDAWLLAPDDLDLDAARQDKKLPAALRAFSLDAQCVERAGYVALYDKFTRKSA